MTDQTTLSDEHKALVEAMARAICAADGRDWDELCAYEADPDAEECESSTCVASFDEDHNPADARRFCLRQDEGAASVIGAMEYEVLTLRAALETICVHSNPDWDEVSADPAGKIEMIHGIAVAARFGKESE